MNLPGVLHDFAHHVPDVDVDLFFASVPCTLLDPDGTQRLRTGKIIKKSPIGSMHLHRLLIQSHDLLRPFLVTSTSTNNRNVLCGTLP